ncbi:MAG: hypothetical protein HY360_20965 [Verrucomicrobia bacterium]|nr:hypothetical protein [Verrucomicrobiota bacterium]
MSEVALSEIPVEMLERLAVRCEGYAYFSRDSFGSDWTPGGQEPPHPDTTRLMASALPRLTAAFQMTYSPRIWRFAGELCNYLIFHSGLFDSSGEPHWKKTPAPNDELDLLQCLDSVMHLGVLGQHKPWLDWALKGIQRRLSMADNEVGWPRQLFAQAASDALADVGAREAMLCLRAVTLDPALWDAIEKRIFNPPQLLKPNMPADAARNGLIQEASSRMAVKQENEHFQIHLWMPYEDDAIHIISGMPERGALFIEAPSVAQVSLRIPDWLALNTVRINESPVSEVLLKLKPGFMDLPIAVQATDRSRWKIEFAIPSQTREFRVPPSTYNAVWRGPYMMRLSSKDEATVLFERPRAAPVAVPLGSSQLLSKLAKKRTADSPRNTAAMTARFTVVSITEAPLFSTKELLLYLDKCVVSAKAGRLSEDVRQAAMDVERMYAGRWPGLVPCTLPYHDLKHVWTVTAALGDLLCGMHTGGLAVGARHFRMALAAMLLHGTGILKSGVHTKRHYEMSADFAVDYVSRFGASFGGQSQELIRILILSTGYDAQVDLTACPDDLWRQVAYAMGTAKLLGQMASADYLDRLPELFSEVNLAEAEGAAASDQPHSVQDLPSYFSNFVVKSLSDRLGMVYMYYRFLTSDQHNPYLESAEKHMRRVERRRAGESSPTSPPDP